MAHEPVVCMLDAPSDESVRAFVAAVLEGARGAGSERELQELVVARVLARSLAAGSIDVRCEVRCKRGDAAGRLDVLVRRRSRREPFCVLELKLVREADADRDEQAQYISRKYARQLRLHHESLALAPDAAVHRIGEPSGARPARKGRVRVSLEDTARAALGQACSYRDIPDVGPKRRAMRIGLVLCGSSVFYAFRE